MSKELLGSQPSEFENHLTACQSCNNEHTQYTAEKKQFFAHAVLCEETPEHLDKKIIALCSKPVVPTSIGLFFSPWIKKAVFSTLVFALGVGAGGYFTFAYYQSKSSAPYAQGQKTAPQQQAAAASPVSTASNPSNLTLDTSKQAPPSLLKPGVRPSPAPGSSSQGIITVDLKKE
jgi:hypothetical protein